MNRKGILLRIFLFSITVIVTSFAASTFFPEVFSFTRENIVMEFIMILAFSLSLIFYNKKQKS